MFYCRFLLHYYATTSHCPLEDSLSIDIYSVLGYALSKYPTNYPLRMFASNLMGYASLSTVDNVVSEFINKNIKEQQLNRGKKGKKKKWEEEEDEEEDGGELGNELDFKIDKEDLNADIVSSDSSSHISLNRYSSSLIYLHNALALIPVSCVHISSSDSPWPGIRPQILSQELIRKSIFSPISLQKNDKNVPVISGWNSLLNHYIRFGFETTGGTSKLPVVAKQASQTNPSIIPPAIAPVATPLASLWNAPISQEAYAQMSAERQQQYGLWYQQYYYQQLLAQQQQQQQQQQTQK
jgi:hypothetical protein